MFEGSGASSKRWKSQDIWITTIIYTLRYDTLRVGPPRPSRKPEKQTKTLGNRKNKKQQFAGPMPKPELQKTLGNQKINKKQIYTANAQARIPKNPEKTKKTKNQICRTSVLARAGHWPCIFLCFDFPRMFLQFWLGHWPCKFIF